MEENHARGLLEAELKQIDADVETEVADRASQIVQDRSADGMDIADSGSRVAESMDRDLTTGTLRRRRQQVLSALERVDDGSYGRCAVCGNPIDDERLTARPETDRCRKHPEGPDEIGGVEP